MEAQIDAHPLLTKHCAASTLRWHPHFILRLAALPDVAVQDMGSPDLRPALERVSVLEKRMTAMGETVHQMLYDAVASTADRKLKNQLLDARRRLMNGKLPDEKRRVLALRLSEAESAVIDAYEDVVRELDAANRELLETATRARLTARRALQRHVQSEPFRRGLLLSSASLAQNLARYERTPGERFVSRDEQIERGLLRYFTRTVMKATPFSAFCTVATGAFAPGVRETAPTFIGDPTSTRAAIRLNKSLYGLLWHHVRSVPAIRQVLTVRLNPTLSQSDQQFVFLMGRGKREIFQRLRRTPALDRVAATLSSDADVTFRQVVQRLVADPLIEATEAEAIAFLDSLEHHGLLRLQSCVGEQEAEWDGVFCELLSRTDDASAKTIIACLERLRTGADQYSEADSASRARLLSAMSDNVAEALAALGIAAQRLPPIYEDVGTDARLAVPELVVEDALSAMARLITVLDSSGWPHDECATMRAFFDARYQDPDARIPLLQFYETYYREQFKEHLERVSLQRRGTKPPAGYDVVNPLALPAIDAMRTRRTLITNVLLKKLAESPLADEVHFTAREVTDESFVPSCVGRCRSYTAFGQFVLDGPHRGRLVVPDARYLVGFGKYFSRFLHILPTEVSTTLRRANSDATRDILAEICGDAHFNPNLHPPMMGHAIAYPTADVDSGAAQVLCTDIVVTRDPVDPCALQLTGASDGRRVLPVDLGFMSSRLRPPLYQLLSRFVPSSQNTVSVPELVGPPSPDGVDYRPRIVFEDAVVVARRRWTVTGNAFPAHVPGETLAALVRRLHEWRTKHRIPTEVYVRVFPRLASRVGDQPPDPAPDPETDELAIEDPLKEGTTSSQESGHEVVEVDTDESAPGGEIGAKTERAANAARPSHMSRDYGKPQYIDFDNMLLLDLFTRLPAPLKHFSVWIEERYPTSDGLPTYADGRYVNEVIVQFTENDTRSGESWRR